MNLEIESKSAVLLNSYVFQCYYLFIYIKYLLMIKIKDYRHLKTIALR